MAFPAGDLLFLGSSPEQRGFLFYLHGTPEPPLATSSVVFIAHLSVLSLKPTGRGKILNWVLRLHIAFAVFKGVSSHEHSALANGSSQRPHFDLLTERDITDRNGTRLDICLETINLDTHRN